MPRVRFERVADEQRPPSARVPLGGAARRSAAPLPDDVVAEIIGATSRNVGARMTTRLADATAAYERARYGDAKRMAKSVLRAAPESRAAAELHALCQYRLGYYRAAAKELEVLLEADHTYSHHPVLADCYRAMGRYARARTVWNELKDASPSPELMAEGRIVMAGVLADQDRVGEAIDLLEKAVRPLRKPREHHIRTWFALGALYERAGDTARAKVLFSQVYAADPQMADVVARLEDLS